MEGTVYKLLDEFPNILDVISYKTEKLHEILEIQQK